MGTAIVASENVVELAPAAHEITREPLFLAGKILAPAPPEKLAIQEDDVYLYWREEEWMN